MMRDIIFVLFRWLNLAVLVGIVVFLVRFKLWHIVLQAVYDRKNILNNLKQELRGAVSKNEHLTDEMEEQILEAKRLQAQLNDWQRKISDRNHERQDQLRNIERRFAEQEKVRHQYREQQRVLQEVVPLALERAGVELESEFAHDERQASYLKSIIEFMRKEPV